MDQEIILWIGGLLLIPLLVFLPRPFKSIYSMIIMVGVSALTSSFAITALTNNIYIKYITTLPVIGIIQFEVDKLSACFILLINFLVLVSGLYSVGYLRRFLDHPTISLHLIAINFLHLALLQVCMLQNLFAFLIVWEIMAVAIFFAMLLDFERKDVVKSAINFIVQMHLSFFFLLAATLILQNSTGKADFGALTTYFKSHDNTLLFVLFLIGFGIKAGFLMGHSWITNTYPNAPSNLTVMMSGLTINMGLYGILRVISHLESQHFVLGIILLVIGILNSIYGITNSAMQRDLKKALAFSSIENVGLICIGLGVGLLGISTKNNLTSFLGFSGAVLHIFNHALFKPLLFMGAGAVYVSNRTTNMEKLGGLFKSMPWTGTCFLLGSLAICGLPPLNGFVSEFLLYQSLLKGMGENNVFVEVLYLISMVILALVGGLSIFAFTKNFGLAFLGAARSEYAHSGKEAPISMVIPQVILTCGLITIAFVPYYFFDFTFNIIQFLLKSEIKSRNFVTNVLQSDSIISIAFILILSTLLALRFLHFRYIHVTRGDIWACGYLTIRPNMQYTSASYARHLSKLASVMVGYKPIYKKIAVNDIFPTTREFEVYVYDKVEKNFLSTPIKLMHFIIKRFAFLETGQTQSYIWYAFIFILILFSLTILNII